MENILEVQNVQKKIGSKVIIDEVSFHVPKGKIVGLLGPNGAGKTTLIRMIVGLMRLSQGEITIANHSLKKLTAKQLPKSERLWKILNFIII